MIGLFEVAEHLSSRANALVGDDSADAFGRSAFNRYYYASFHSVRELLLALDESWAKAPHKNLPGLLEDDLIKRMKALAKQQERLGALNAARGRALLGQAQNAASDIAMILRAAYAVRIAADYEPTKSVSFFVGGFRLVEHTNAEARNWKDRVDKKKGILLRIAKELGFDV
jgi:hypothetical protein